MVLVILPIKILYVYFFDAPLGWQEHYYLYPLPLKQLALNTNLEQNPVWTK